MTAIAERSPGPPVTTPEVTMVTALNQALADPRLRTVVFASGSAVRGLVKLAEEDPRRLVAVTIGPATTLVAREHGFEVAAEADRPTVEGLLEVIQHAA